MKAITNFPLLLSVAICCFPTQGFAVTIETVLIGNVNNLADATGYGAVPYEYRIGTYEVTNAQFTEFLNAVAATNDKSLYNSNMDTNNHGGITQSGVDGSFTYQAKAGKEDRPVNFVNVTDMARFANWLHNGQGSGDTETGAYALDSSGGNSEMAASIVRLPGAKWFIPSENEWYKAAYHMNDGDTSNYYSYATSSNSMPAASVPTSTPNTANYAFVAGSPTDVGSYTGSASPYGTFDQNGNAQEFTESFYEVGNSFFRTMRGGDWGDGASPDMFVSTSRSRRNFTNADNTIGFRMAAAVIPEPSSLLLGALACVSLLMRRRH